MISKDLIAASATPIILGLLMREDSYGYAIIDDARQLSNGLLNWADGMLYPILHRLEKNEFIESYWGKSPTGRRRKYYRITQQGRDFHQTQTQQWRQLATIISQLEVKDV